MRIGLTGGFSCGKSTAAHFFAELGATIIDADDIAHEMVAKGTPALAKIIEHFGATFLDPQGELNRVKLAAVIFADSQQRQWLEDLLHPIILTEMLRRAQLASSPYCILVIPLLLEKQLQDQVDRVLVIDAAEDLQKQRALQRNSNSQLSAILQSQLDRTTRLSYADDVLYNDGDLTALKQQVIKLHEKYLAEASQ